MIHFKIFSEFAKRFQGKPQSRKKGPFSPAPFVMPFRIRQRIGSKEKLGKLNSSELSAGSHISTASQPSSLR